MILCVTEQEKRVWDTAFAAKYVALQATSLREVALTKAEQVADIAVMDLRALLTRRLK